MLAAALDEGATDSVIVALFMTALPRMEALTLAILV